MNSASDVTIKGERLQAPHSLGVDPPKMAAPAGATDCHHHIADPRFPRPGGGLIPATVEDYRKLKRRLGISRSIVVAASPYWDDNRVVVDALDQFGPREARGIAIVNPDVSDAELDRLGKHGVRGLRIYLGKIRIPTPDELKTFGVRCADRGWHLQIVSDRHRECVAEWEKALADLACPIVVDHFGFAPHPPGNRSATADAIRRLLDNGKSYVKLSGVYLTSGAGYPDYPDVDEMAIDLAAHAPERVLWGTDWPHPVAKEHFPDDAMLFDRLAVWVPDEDRRRQMLVDNPDRLYWRD